MSEQQRPAQAVAAEEWLTVKQVAERARIHDQTVRQYIADGLIPYQQARKRGAIRIEWGAFCRAMSANRSTNGAGSAPV
jgi:excisionase family DNA binding protein